MINVKFCNKLIREKNKIIDAHSHKCHELLFYCNGFGTTTVNGITHDIPNNALYYVNPGTEHSEKFAEDTTLFYIGFECDDFETADGIHRPKEIDAVVRLLEDMFFEFENQKMHFKRILSLKMEEILIILSRNSANAIQMQKDIKYCTNYIEENFDQNIDFRELASTYGYSYHYFRHMFKCAFDTSPQNYLINTRLKESKKKLLYTSLNCTEIAYICGFSDSAQFSKVFKKQYSVSPKEYRRKKLSEEVLYGDPEVP